jgi:hypothetical protein
MRVGRIKGTIGIALLAGAVLTCTSACGGSASATSSGTKPVASQSAASPVTSTKPTSTPSAAAPTTHPAGPPMLLNTIEPENGSTVGVAMPISVVFTDPVATSARAAIEKAMKVTTSVPVTGAWDWLTSTRVDWRPEKFWPAGTKVTLNAALDNIGDGHGEYGIHGYTHSFTIGQDT